jgi:hypothetical protein
MRAGWVLLLHQLHHLNAAGFPWTGYASTPGIAWGLYGKNRLYRAA